MLGSTEKAWTEQQLRNQKLLGETPFLGAQITSKILPFKLDPTAKACLTPQEDLALQALEIEAGRIAIEALAALAEIGEIDHLGGGMGLIGPLTMSLAMVDYEGVEFTIENAHCSIGYYSALAARGFLSRERVVDHFRRSLDIAGHVSWVPGGTQLNGGRLGVMVPAAVGQALAKRAIYGDAAWVICHCGDAGWISGQALNGFNVADFHGAPVTFVMDRNGIQLSGSNAQVMDKDPRPILAGLGVEILETTSVHDMAGLYAAYREARELAANGRPTMIYPVGYDTAGNDIVDLEFLGDLYGIRREVEDFAAANDVSMDTRVWIPGALMSFRDIVPMLECIFLVNNLPGGKGHHDGGMKGRSREAVLANPMLTPTAEQQGALNALRNQAPLEVVTTARPAVGSANLVLDAAARAAVSLPAAGAKKSPRVGVQAAYELVAKTWPDKMFVVSCDLNPSTKLDKACAALAADHQFEVSIEEQVAAIMTNGIACASHGPQFNVVSTFAAFYEGIAREGFEMWRYQRNLNGVNEGLNVAFHLSHVGACTGRDHFSGWSLDWVNLGIEYLPYLHRLYTPADARAAFIAVCDMAAHYGAHIIGVPRDNLPVLAKADGTPLFDAAADFEEVTALRQVAGARKAILALGATAFLALEAAEAMDEAVDVYVINGLPLPEDQLDGLIAGYAGLVTVEDGLIGTRKTGLRGFASLIAAAAAGQVPTDHIGLVDPRIAPAEDFRPLWDHFGLTAAAITAAVAGL